MDINYTLQNYVTELRYSSKIMIGKGFINNRMLPNIIYHDIFKNTLFGSCFLGIELGNGTNWILEGSRAIEKQDRTKQNGTISRDLAPSPV